MSTYIYDPETGNYYDPIADTYYDPRTQVGVWEESFTHRTFLQTALSGEISQLGPEDRKHRTCGGSFVSLTQSCIEGTRVPKYPFNERLQTH